MAGLKQSEQSGEARRCAGTPQAHFPVVSTCCDSLAICRPAQELAEPANHLTTRQRDDVYGPVTRIVSSLTMM
jgi:hypothetical protein